MILVNNKFDFPSQLVADNIRWKLNLYLLNVIFAGEGRSFLETGDIHGSVQSVQLHQEERLPASIHHLAAPRHVSSV